MIKGKRIKVPQWIHGTQCVVRVDVDAVIPDADPSEPCFEPPAVRWMDELQRLADAGDVAVAEDAEAAAEEALLDAVALDVLGGEEPDERLCSREPHAPAPVRSLTRARP